MRFLPTIDTLNKLRQDTLRVEDQWRTKNCWLKLLHGYMGMTVINQQKLMQYYYPDVPGKDLTVMDMAASISSGLVQRDRTVLPFPIREEAAHAAGNSPLQ